MYVEKQFTECVSQKMSITPVCVVFLILLDVLVCSITAYVYELSLMRQFYVPPPTYPVNRYSTVQITLRYCSKFVLVPSEVG